MRPPFAALAFLILLVAADSKLLVIAETNKFRARQPSDDLVGFPPIDESTLLSSKCPKHVELRWQSEVSSSIVASPLIADINSDGKLDVVVPSFVHYLDILEGSDGDKMPGWPVFHQSMVHSSPLLYDIDKDGTREIAVATYNGMIHFFRVSGYLMMDKLEVPRRKVRKDWYLGLINPDAHLGEYKNSSFQEIESKFNASEHKIDAKMDSTEKQNKELLNNTNATNMGNATAGNVLNENMPHPQRRLLESTGEKQAQEGISESHDSDSDLKVTTVENDEILSKEADSSFDLIREVEDLPDEYHYDYDDYVDESMWGDENWAEQVHKILEDYVSIDAHILCTPVIADIDHDGVQEMVVAASYFFDHQYYDNPEHRKDLGDIDIGKYIATGVVVFNLDTKQVKWATDLDLSTEDGDFPAYAHSAPTVVDLDGDGKLDIIVGTGFGLLYVLDHHGKVRRNFPHEMSAIYAPVVAADINDDGEIEIVGADNHGNVAAWTAKGEQIWDVHLKSSIHQGPTIGDVNGDGQTDIVVPTVSGNIYVLRGKDGSSVMPFPFRTGGRLMSPVTLLDLSKSDEKFKGLTLATTSFDGYLYLIEGFSGCVDAVDIGETSYSMVLADNVDGGDDLDIIVSTMNGNVLCFSSPSPYHPLKSWKSPTQGRNNAVLRHNRQGVYVSTASRTYRDEGGSHFWVEFEIVDNYLVPLGNLAPYNITATLLVPGNYQGSRQITVNRLYKQPGKQRLKLPTVPVRTTGTVQLEMVDKNGMFFSDEFSITFHMHYYKLLKWLVLLPMLAMFAILVVLRSQEGSPLPSFSRNID